MAAEGCNEIKIPLLRNEIMLCWFDAGNFALFHKFRAELDRYFETTTDPGESSMKTILKQLYDHYTGIAKVKDLRVLINTFIENATVQEIFKKEIITPYTAKNNFQRSPTQYAKDSEGPFSSISSSIQKKFIKDNSYNLKKNGDMYEFKTERLTQTGEPTDDLSEGSIYLITFTKAEIDTLFNPPTQQTKDNFDIKRQDGNDVDEYIDIFVNALKIFDTALLRQHDDSLIISSSKYNPKNPFDYDITFLLDQKNFITHDTDTLLIDTGYTKGETKQLNYPEYITLPSYSTTNSMVNLVNTTKQIQTFQLDAIVVHDSGYHYFTYVRCGNTDDWVKYDDTTFEEDNKSLQDIGIKKEKIFASFPASSTQTPGINKTAKLLIYSRITLITLIFDMDETLIPAGPIIDTTPVNSRLARIIAYAHKRKRDGMNIQLILYTNNTNDTRIDECKDICLLAVNKELVKIQNRNGGNEADIRKEDLFTAELTGKRLIKDTGTDPKKRMKNLTENIGTKDLNLGNNIFFFDDNNKHKQEGGLGFDLGDNFIQIIPPYDGVKEDTTDYSRVEEILNIPSSPKAATP